MNSVTQRLIIQLRQERNEIDGAIRRLEGEPDSVPQKPKRVQHRARKAFSSTSTTSTSASKSYTPCIHGCGKEFKNDGWRTRHEADCAFVVKPSGTRAI